MVPYDSKTVQNWCQMGPKCTKMGPRWIQNAPRCLKVGPRGSRRSQDGPKMGLRGPIWSQDGPKMVPRGPQGGPKRTPSGHQVVQDGLERCQDVSSMRPYESIWRTSLLPNVFFRNFKKYCFSLCFSIKITSWGDQNGILYVPFAIKLPH